MWFQWTFLWPCYFLCAIKATPLQHKISFRALSLLSLCVWMKLVPPAFHYSFSPSPPPITPVTSNTGLVVLWRRTPLSARKLLDHRGTSSWRLYCVFMPSMQSRTAARHIIYCMTCGLRFSSRGGRIISSSPAHKDDQVLVCGLCSCFGDGKEFLIHNMYFWNDLFLGYFTVGMRFA